MLDAVKAKNAAVKLLNKRAIVVGGTSGIGEGIARRLAKANVSVTIVGRNQERGNKIVSQLQELGGSDHSFISCDCFSLNNAHDCCQIIRNKYSSIDYLVVSQGIASIDGRVETVDKIEQKLAVHYFSRVVFIRELLPSLRQAPEGAKVLSVLSGGVHSPYSLYREDFELKNNFSIKNCADAAGFYNDIALDCFSRGIETSDNSSSNSAANKNIHFIHAAPGIVNTRWGHDLPIYVSVFVRMLQYFARNIDDCGEMMCEPLFNTPTINNNASSNFYVMSANAEQVRVTNLHEEARSTVWQQTWQIVDSILRNNQNDSVK